MVHISQALLQLALIGTLILSLSRQAKHQIAQRIIFPLLGVISLGQSWGRIQRQGMKAWIIAAFTVRSLWLRSPGLFRFHNLQGKCKTSRLWDVLEKLFLDRFYNSAVTDSNPNANTVTGRQKHFITLIVEEK